MADEDAGQRRQLHEMWAGVAPGWYEQAEENDRRHEPVTGRMLARTTPAAGERVLDLACGPGGTGMAAAPLVGPDGAVVVSDVAEPMVAIAQRRAAARGIGNLSGAIVDLEAIDQPDGSFDVALCQFGLMFAVDKPRALREVARVLRPGGRVAFGTWGPRPENPWLGAALDALGDHLGITLPPPGTPGPFSLSDAEELGALLSADGFGDVAVEQVDCPYDAPTFDLWWTRTCSCAGPVAAVIAGLPSEAQDAVRERARELVAPFVAHDGSLLLPGVALVASGTVRRS